MNELKIIVGALAIFLMAICGMVTIDHWRSSHLDGGTVEAKQWIDTQYIPQCLPVSYGKITTLQTTITIVPEHGVLTIRKGDRRGSIECSSQDYNHYQVGATWP